MTSKLHLILLFCSVFLLLFSCNDNVKKLPEEKAPIKPKNIIYTSYSKQENSYIGFNSPKAINRIADIENEYFNSIENSYSKYYGTDWYKTAIYEKVFNDTISVFEKYLQELSKLGKKPDSMHCTIYAVEAVKAGLDSNFYKLKKIHKQIWGNREYAGWSIGYILVKEFDWSAYLILNDNYVNYKSCLRNYKNYKKYNVWKQPNIPLVALYNMQDDREEIDSLLKSHEFGWGFSEQGWHTWITRYDTLKECRWEGVPSLKLYNGYDAPLFKNTKFIEFYDYDSHVVIFPPKK